MRIVKAMTEKLLYHLSLNFKPLKYPKGLIRFEALKRPKRYRDIDIDIDIPHSRVGMYISKWNWMNKFDQSGIGFSSMWFHKNIGTFLRA